MKSWTARICLLVSILGAPLYLWGYLAQWDLGAWPASHPIPPQGPITGPGWSVGSLEDLRFVLEAYGPGTAMELQTADGAFHAASLIRARGITELLVTAMSGILFWFVAAFVFGPRAGREGVGAFFWCSFLFGLAIMVGGVSYPLTHAPHLLLAGALHVICLALLPPAFLHLALRFPRRHLGLARRHWFITVPWVLAAAICTWELAALFLLPAQPTPGCTDLRRVPERLADLLLVLQVGAGLVLLFLAGRRFELTREQRQVKWLLWGMAVGVTPYVFLRTVPGLFGVPSPVPIGVDRLFEMAAPVAFVIAVVRHQFLDIDIVIRRSLIYGTISLVIILLALSVAWAFHRGTDAVPRDSMFLIATVVGLGAGLSYGPLRRGVGAVVDRFFFRIERDYGHALRRLAGALDRATTGEEAVTALLDAIGGTLHVRARGAYLLDGPHGDADHVATLGHVPALTCAPHLFRAAARSTAPILASPQSTSLPEIEVPFPAEAALAGVVLVAPLRARDVLGLAVLGVKETGRRWTESDLRFVRRSVREAARVLERFRMMREAEEERGARERLEEMNRLKGEFLARVAHDLRTPLTSVNWSTENLLDGVPGPINEAQAAYLRTVRASTLHLQRLVDNLLEASRIDQGREAGAREEVALEGVVAQACDTVRALAVEKGVRIKQTPLPPLHPIPGNTHRLLQVLINLLDNAVKYSPQGAVVEVSFGALDSKTQGVQIRDHGDGWQHEHPEVFFEPYHQGARSPHSGRLGFGLGLYIVKTFVTEAGGTVHAYDAAEGGAVVECRFSNPRTFDEAQR